MSLQTGWGVPPEQPGAKDRYRGRITCGAHRPWCWELLMDASAPGLDTMMYREPEDIWIFKVATLNRITNPDCVHNEASALAELHLVHKPGAF